MDSAIVYWILLATVWNSKTDVTLACTVDIIKWNSIKKSGMCFECAMHRVGVSIWVEGTTSR